MDIIRIRYIKKWISQLPPGNITYKTIKGKKYPYYQWTEDGKQHGRRVKDDELIELSEKIEQRKTLEKKLKDSGATADLLDEKFFFSLVKTDKELLDFVAPVKNLKKRNCYKNLHEYIYGNSTDRVFILYGLRRTGKTTLIRQLISEMSEEMLMQTAFMQINSTIDLAKLNIDLKQLSKMGYRYVFIDEVTLMSDFIDCAALFSDVYASSGMKIVLSGTDSLGFLFSEDNELYDRCFMTHTTFIPYAEFENVLEIKGIDEYIRYGGTMSLGGVNYNQSGMTFATKESTKEYINSAIARNIQHSLKNYQNGNHFRNLIELYDANELTSAINRIVEDINHRFTIEVLTKDFVSSDLSLSAKNLLRDREQSNDVLYRVDKKEVTENLRKLLEIKNKPEQSVSITEAHKVEIKQYLDMLDLTVELETVSMTDLNKKEKRTAISQPGMRYSQAEALIKTLLRDDVFRMLSLKERNYVTERILSDVRGRMMEDIILLETKMAKPSCEVFKVVFAKGEFDMVVFDPEKANCSIYEIKHSTKAVPEQYKHLVDKANCDETEFRFGNITGKYVIYRGESHETNGIQYLNVEEYLRNLVN
ncbi:MAG: AAA family ATPase [Acutalibacteraceae bacterium]|nr:AAA family ATPase [Acutalibacteraceae bacterium]